MSARCCKNRTTRETSPRGGLPEPRSKHGALTFPPKRGAWSLLAIVTPCTTRTYTSAHDIKNTVFSQGTSEEGGETASTPPVPPQHRENCHAVRRSPTLGSHRPWEQHHEIETRADTCAPTQVGFVTPLGAEVIGGLEIAHPLMTRKNSRSGAATSPKNNPLCDSFAGAPTFAPYATMRPLQGLHYLTCICISLACLARRASALPSFPRGRTDESHRAF